MGVRIFALAKELDMTSKQLISFLKTQWHKGSSHMSSIDDPVAKILRDRLKPKETEAQAEKPKASPAAAKRGESKPAGSATQKTPAAAPGKKKTVRRFGQKHQKKLYKIKISQLFGQNMQKIWGNHRGKNIN